MDLVNVNDKIEFVLVSGFESDDMIERSRNLALYKCPTVVDAISKANRAIHKPLQDVNKPVDMHYETLLEALPGDNVGFNVKNFAGEIGNGYPPVLDCQTSHIVVKSVVVIFVIEKRLDKDIRKNVNRPLGRLAGREKRRIVAFGHYIYTLGGGVDKRMLKGVSEAADMNKWLFKYAVVLDKLEAACNKIESTNTTRMYSKGSCEKSSDEVSSYLKKVSYNPDRIPFVANSGFEGDDMTDISSSVDWYEGPILLEALDSISEPKGRTLKQLCFALQDVYMIGGIEAVPARSCVETGVINTGIVITFGFTSLTTEVKPVEMHHETLLESLPGDNVGFNVKNVAGEIGNGYAPVLDCHTSHIVVKSVVVIFEIEKRLDKDIRKNVDICFATVTPFSEFPLLGHLAGREKRQIVAFGHYVYTLGGVDKRMLTGLSEAADMNKRLFKYAVVLDKLEAACNKIESTNTTRKYSKGSWEKSSDEVSSYLKKVGYKTDKIPFVPISGFEGDNLIELSSRLKELDLISESKGATVKPLCFVLQNVYITGCIEAVPVRCLETGEIKPDVVCTFGHSRCGSSP